MKRIFTLLLIVAVCLAFVGCSNDNTANKEETKTKHTVPATDVINNDVEWAQVLCDVQLKDSSGSPVLIGKDFETFALYGSTDADSYIAMKVSDTATETIKALSSADTMTFLINNVEVATVDINPKTFDGEFEFGHTDTFSQLCEFANIIRGLY